MNKINSIHLLKKANKLTVQLFFVTSIIFTAINLEAESQIDETLLPMAIGSLRVWSSSNALYSIEEEKLVPERGLFLFNNKFKNERPKDWPILQVVDEIIIGSLIKGYLYSNSPIEHIEVVLENSDGIKLNGVSFPIGLDKKGEVWAILVPVSTTVNSGVAYLSVNGSYAKTYKSENAFEFIFINELIVKSKFFQSEEISLTSALSDLRETSDKRRVEQTQMLTDLLFTTRYFRNYYYGELQLPLSDAVRSAGFGDRRIYKYDDGSSTRSIHNGIDFASPEGEIIFASGSGMVVMAEKRMITGLSLAIEHLPGVYSLYYHLDSIKVIKGDLVEKGQVVGTVGKSGFATGAHLHWEVRVGGIAIDPDTIVHKSLLDIPDNLYIIGR